jgi:hypothetical protein
LSGEGKKHAELADETGVHETEANNKTRRVAEMYVSTELESEWTALLEIEFLRNALGLARVAGEAGLEMAYNRHQ